MKSTQSMRRPWHGFFAHRRKRMKKTLVAHLPDETPQELRRFAAGAALYDSSCSAGAKVWLIEKGRGYYLKSAGRGALEREAGLTKYFWAKGLGAEVLAGGVDGGGAEDALATGGRASAALPFAARASPGRQPPPPSRGDRGDGSRGCSRRRGAAQLRAAMPASLRFGSTGVSSGENLPARARRRPA